MIRDCFRGESKFWWTLQGKESRVHEFKNKQVNIWETNTNISMQLELRHMTPKSRKKMSTKTIFLYENTKRSIRNY